MSSTLRAGGGGRGGINGNHQGLATGMGFKNMVLREQSKKYMAY